MPQLQGQQAFDEESNRKMFNALRNAAAASLAGGIIAASGKPHSADEAMHVLEEVRQAMRAAQARGAAIPAA